MVKEGTLPEYVWREVDNDEVNSAINKFVDNPKERLRQFTTSSGHDVYIGRSVDGDRVRKIKVEIEIKL